MTGVAPFTDPASGAFLGLGWVRGSTEVSADGQTLTGTYAIEPPPALAGAMGIPEGELGPTPITGERIALEPMGEAVAPLPEVLLTGPSAARSAGPDASPMGSEASPAPEATPGAVRRHPAGVRGPLPRG